MMRALIDAEVGGGAGFDGEFSYRQMIGGYLGVSGLTLRGGMSVVLRGNPEYWHSKWELPALETGWIFSDGQLAAEAGMRAALVAIGRFNVQGSAEKLGGSLAWGPYALLSFRGEATRGMLIAELNRLERARPVHELDARMCGGTGAWLLCARIEQSWATAAETPASTFDSIARITAVGTTIAVTAP
jgi:hypothetical protein